MSIKGALSAILAHPITKGLGLDDPLTTSIRRGIIKDKAYLKKIYIEWYNLIIDQLPEGGRVLEIGSGPGFFSELLPNLVTSEVFPTPGVDIVADAKNLPFKNGELSSIVMTDVLHHIPGVGDFFNEAARCVGPAGRIVMIEPWRNSWSEWVYKNLHHEPFEPRAGWDIPLTGPLSGANGALPWILFERDRALFEKRYPQWKLCSIEPVMPLSYVLSGGVSLRSIVPGFAYRLIRKIEKLTSDKKFGMFALIVLERASTSH